MEGLEERLAAMELAVANLQESIKSITKEVELKSTDKLVSSIEALTERLDTIAALPHSTSRSGRYAPWSEDHETLPLHRYVAKEVLLSVMWKALRVVDSSNTGCKEVNRLLDTMPAYTISRYKRFPKHGQYINIEHLDVYYKLHQLREFAHKGDSGDRYSGIDQFKTVVSTLQTLALSNVGSGRIVGMIHDRRSFEEEYQLTWVQDRTDADQASEPSNGVEELIKDRVSGEENDAIGGE